MDVKSTIAWARGRDRWVAVAPVIGLAAGGGLLVRASVLALAARAGAAPLATWRGELVLRDGHRLAIGGDDCAAQAEGGSLALRGAALTGLDGELWRAARVELSFPDDYL